MSNNIETKYYSAKMRTPLDIKVTLILFAIVLVLKIGMSNTYENEVFSLILFYVWFFSCLIFRPKITLKILRQKHYFVLSIFLLYFFFGNSFSNGLFTGIKSTGAYIQYLSPIFMYEFYSRFSSKKVDRLLIIFIMSIYLYFSIRTLLYLDINPLAARKMISSGIDDVIMIGGGFSLSYGFAILIPVLIYIIMNMRNVRHIKIFYYSIVILFFLVILKSQFATSFFLVLLGFLYVMAYKMKQNKTLLFFSFLLLIVFYLSQDYLIRELTNYLNTLDSVFSNRVLLTLEIKQADNMRDLGTFGSRVTLFTNTLHLWFDNLFFGVAYKLDFDQDKMMNAGVGNHAEWIDLLAKHGLVSLSLLYYIFCSKKVYLNNFSFRISLLLLFILGFLNPVHIFNIFFVVFFFAPLLERYIQRLN